MKGKGLEDGYISCVGCDLSGSWILRSDLCILLFADLQEAGKKEGTTGILGSICEGDPVTLTQDIWKGKDHNQHINLAFF